MSSSEAHNPSRYQSLGRIGRGGMAEVLLAATQSSGVTKLAVLKCLWPDLAEDPAFTEMFLDEARLGARLNHPNIVHTYEVVQHEGRLAMAMEYVDGPSLKSMLARLPGDALDLPARLRIMTSVLAALEYAHTLTALDGSALDVVHRDVSPHNVLVTYDGHVKLLDFGIAKTLAARHQTRPGGVKGKLAYLAPEAIRGDAVDRRADVFSVGVMLWEILAGRRLWETSNDGGLSSRLTSEAPPPQLPAGLDVPDALRAVCMRALSPDPAARHQTAAELGADLERFGVVGTDTQARHLGRLVSGVFQSERARRQALIGAHVRSLAEAEPDYVAFELSLSDEPPPSEVSPAANVGPMSAAWEDLTGQVGPARRRGPRTFVVAAVAAAVALVAGVFIGQRPIPWPMSTLFSVSRSLSPEPSPAPVVPARSPFEPAPVPAVAEAPLPTVQVQPVAERREGSLERHARSRRAAHARRARPLDLLSDDVLGLDGAPLAASAAPATSGSAHD